MLILIYRRLYSDPSSINLTEIAVELWTCPRSQLSSGISHVTPAIHHHTHLLIHIHIHILTRAPQQRAHSFTDTYSDLGENPSREAAELFERLDKDNSGSIDFREFVLGVYEYLVHYQVTAPHRTAPQNTAGRAQI